MRLNSPDTQATGFYSTQFLQAYYADPNLRNAIDPQLYANVLAADTKETAYPALRAYAQELALLPTQTPGTRAMFYALADEIIRLEQQ